MIGLYLVGQRAAVVCQLAAGTPQLTSLTPLTPLTPLSPLSPLSALTVAIVLESYIVRLHTPFCEV